MENKKILYAITQAEWGGAQRYLYDLITSSEAKNWDISVAVGQSGNTDLIKKLEQKNIKIHQLKHLVRPISPFHDLLAILELKKLYKQLRPDIIHLNSTKAGILGSLAGGYKLKAKSYKLIYTVHGWVFNEPLNPIKNKLYYWLEKFTARFKDKIICVSEYDRQMALNKKITAKNKLITINNGIEVDSIKFLSKEEARKKLLNSPQDSPEMTIVGTVANFYATKGLKYLIESFNLLVNNYKLPAISYKLIIIGDGDRRSELENLIANYNLKNHILLVGKKENAVQYLKAYDIYVCSSVKEGFPYSILEAMIAELPIISTGVGGIPEIIKHEKNGLLIKPKNHGELAGQIKHLMDNPELAKQLGRQAKSDVSEKFSQQDTFQKTFHHYESTN